MSFRAINHPVCRAHREEDDGVDRAVIAERAEQLAAEHRDPHMPATAMNRYDQMRVHPENTPAVGPEPPAGIGVHRPRPRRSFGELVEAEHHEEQHHGAQPVREPGARPRRWRTPGG